MREEEGVTAHRKRGLLCGVFTFMEVEPGRGADVIEFRVSKQCSVIY